MDTSKFISVNDLKKLYGEERWKFLCLLTIDGEILVPYNNNKTTPENKWKEIVKKFDSNLLPEGVYLFKAKNSPGSRTVEEKIFVVKGDLQRMKKEFESKTISENGNGAPTKPTPLSAASSPNVLSWNEALSNIQKIADLNRDLQLAHSRIKELEEENGELEAELSELGEEGDGKNSFETWAEEIFPVLDKGLDKYFSLREKELDQKERQLQLSGAPPSRRPTPRATQENPEQKKQDDFLRYMDGLLAEQNSEQFNKEMNVLAESNPELFSQIETTLADAGIEWREGEDASR